MEALFVMQGNNGRARLGESQWMLSLYPDRLEAYRKAGLGSADTYTMALDEIVSVSTRPNGRKLCDFVMVTAQREFVITHLPLRTGENYVTRSTIILKNASREREPASVVVNVDVNTASTENQLSECPRCGADLHPKMKKCPYCSKPLA